VFFRRRAVPHVFARVEEHKAWIHPAKRKCLQRYCYFMDRQLGLIHVKVQTWFPFPIQVYVNGHECLARRLNRTVRA
jgi:ribosome-binding ATPase